MIAIHKLQKHYHDRLILDIPECKLQKGIYWINGINGSGKTTLLKIIAGLIPFKGDVVIDTIGLKKNPLAYRKLVSYAEAEPLYPSFVTGRELVLFYKDIRKAATVDDLIGFSGLGKQLDKPIGSYSSGMVKRLSLLLAFIGPVPLILLDEPLATLDAAAANALPDLIRAYRKKYDTTFIFSSHQPFLADPLLTAKQLEVSNQTLRHCA